MEKRRISQAIFIVLVYAAVGALGAETTVVTYPAPAGADRADDFVVKVDGKETVVYDSKVAAFAYFSFSSKVTVSVIPGRDIETVDIRPKKKIKGVRHFFC